MPLIGAFLLAAVLAVWTPMGNDYVGPARTFCDCPATPIRALAQGHLHTFFATQPVMGSASLFLRAPFAALGLHTGLGSDLDLYRLGAFPCLLVAALLGAYLLARLRELERPPLACMLGAGLVAVNPLTLRALKYGHPEEILAGALCVAAVLAASRRRPVLAGVFIGAAFASKQWALLAALPVLLAAPEGRWRLALSGATTAVLFVAPMALGDPGRFFHTSHGAGLAGVGAQPTNVWFPFGTDIPAVLGPHGVTTPPRLISATIGNVAHPLILAVGFALALLWWRSRRDAPAEDALVLIALVMLARCLLDPMTNSYYHLPFLMSLAAWEGLRRRGAPVLTVSAVVLISFTVAIANSGVGLVYVNRFYLLWTLPFAALLGLFAFRSQPVRGLVASPA